MRRVFGVLLALAALCGCNKWVLSRPAGSAVPTEIAPAAARVDSVAPVAVSTAPPEDSSPPPPPEDSSPPPPVPARLGVLVPLSGRYASYGRAYLDGAQHAADEWNARGTRHVDVVAADAKTEPLAALAATRRLVDDEHVDAILGSVLTLPTVVAAMEANCHGVPLVSNVATEDDLAT